MRLKLCAVMCLCAIGTAVSLGDQFSLPVSTIAQGGGWTVVGTANLWDAINDNTPDDLTTYAQTSLNGTTATVGVASPNNPYSTSNHSIFFRARMTAAGGTNGNGNYTFRLLQNGTVKATRTGSLSATSFTNLGFGLNAAEAGSLAVTNGKYEGLQLSWSAVNSDPEGLSNSLRITQAYFRCPDAPSQPMITTASPLPQGVRTVVYSQQLAASGGVGPYGWSVFGGSLPGGVTMANDGLLSGTPTASGISSFVIRVTDALGQTANKSFSLTVVNPALYIENASSLPNAVVGVPYSVTFTASGGSGTGYTFSNIGAALPGGLSLSPGGVLSGTPTTSGSHQPEVRVTDSDGGIYDGGFFLVVLAGAPATFEQGEAMIARFDDLAAIGSAAGTVAGDWLIEKAMAVTLLLVCAFFVVLGVLK